MTAFPDPLDVTVELAFGADPDGDPDGWSWTDVTADVKAADGVQITRGRSDESARTQPSTCSFALRNDGGDYTPGLATSPHYPHVRLGVPVRVTVTYSMADHRLFSGFVSEWRPVWPQGDLSTDTDPGYSRVEVACAGLLRRLEQGEQPLGSALPRAISSHPQVVAYWPCEDGSEADAAASPLDGVPPMRPSGVEFGASTTQAGSALHGASSVMRIADPARNVLGRVPSHTPGSAYLVQEAFILPEPADADRAVMDVYTTSADAAVWRMRLSDTVFQLRALDADGSEVINVTEPVSEAVWGRWVRAVLRLQQDGSDIRWQASLLDITSAQTRLHHLQGVEASASMGRIVRAGVNGPGMFQERFAAHITVSTADAAVLDDPWLGARHDTSDVGVVSAFEETLSALGNLNGVTWDGSTLWVSDTQSDELHQIDPADGTVLDTIPAPAGSTPSGMAWDGEALWVADEDGDTVSRINPADGTVLDTIPAPDNRPRGLTWDGEALWVTSLTQDNTVSRINPADGTVLASFPGQTSLRGLAWDGEHLWAAAAATIYRLDQSDGTVLREIPWHRLGIDGLTWDGEALWVVAGGGGRNALYRLDVLVEHSAADGFHGEPAGFRFQRLCAEQGIPAVLVGDGGDTMPMGPQQPATLTGLLRECADTDGGILAEARDEFGLIYRTRTTLYNQDAALELDARPASGPAELAPPFTPTADDQQVRNDVTASRPSGTSVRAVDTGDVDSRGRYDATVTVNPSSDEELAQIAHWRLHLGTWPGMRYPQLSPALAQDPDLIPGWVGLALGDRVQVSNLPPQHPAGDVDLLVQGTSETLTPTDWRAVANMSPAGPYTVFTVEDDELGRADTAGARTAAGLLLTGDAGDYASTPDQPEFHTTEHVGGDFVVTVDAIHPTWDPDGEENLASQFDSANDERAWRLGLMPGGFIRFVWTTDGTLGTATFYQTDTPVPAGPGDRLAVSVWLNVEDDGDHSVHVYAAAEANGTNIGSRFDMNVFTGEGTTTVFDADAPLEVGSRDTGTAGLFTGIILRMMLWDGNVFSGGVLGDGEFVVDVDFAAQSGGITSFTDATGWSWALNGNAEILGSFDAGTGTSLTVVSSGRPWINSSDHAAQFPFEVEVSGVVLEVTAISGATSPQVMTVTQTPVNGVEKTIPSGSAVRLASRHRLAL